MDGQFRHMKKFYNHLIIDLEEFSVLVNWLWVLKLDNKLQEVFIQVTIEQCAYLIILNKTDIKEYLFGHQTNSHTDIIAQITKPLATLPEQFIMKQLGILVGQVVLIQKIQIA